MGNLEELFFLWKHRIVLLKGWTVGNRLYTAADLEELLFQESKLCLLNNLTMCQ